MIIEQRSEMKKYLWIFLLSFVIFLSMVKTHAQALECKYENGSIWVSENLYYLCKLQITSNDFDTKLTEIHGHHKSPYKDSDVHFVKSLNQKLQSLSSSFCKKFSNLETLHFLNAEMKIIEEDSIQNCPNLKYLIIISNKISSVPEYWLIRNTKLEIFWMQDSELTTLPENFFQNQKSLKSISINGNRISFLPSKIFNTLDNLLKIRIDNNKLKYLDPNWFINNKNLEYLDFEHNQITEIPPNVFSSLSHLKQLILSENEIKTLYSKSFSGLKNLEQLILNLNQISDLPPGVFAGLNKLNYLSISYNQLENIHGDSFEGNYKFKDFYLYNNKLNSIDPKAFELINESIVRFDVSNNICANFLSIYGAYIRPMLSKCFSNYTPRLQTGLMQSSCGRLATAHGNIIGGSFTARGSFPWKAALMTLNDEYFCGGTLISDKKVITAAHCFRPKKIPIQKRADEFIVLLGVHDLKKSIEIGRTLAVVLSINIHPNWHILIEQYDADIAVLVLAQQVTFNEFIQPICLIPTNFPSISTGLVVGYCKSEDETKPHEYIPKIIDMPIHSNEDCFLKNFLLVKFSSKRTFCAGSGTGIGVCNGDSGSGLIVLYNGTYYLRGIVSASLLINQGSCDVNNYSVFTDVLKFNDWIDGIESTSSNFYTRK